jgi:preprotein translocase subunit SecE
MAKAALVETNEQQGIGGTHVPAGPERLAQFLRDVRSEMRKVVTASRPEVQATTVVVIATVFIFAAYFEIVDLVLGKGIDQIFSHLTRH